MDRKDFLIKLGIGTSIAVSGYFLWDSANETTLTHKPVSNDKPKLNSNVHSSEENGMLHLSNERNSCSVNKTGQQIISYLDGENTVIDVARKISDFYKLEYSDSIVTSVAYFVSQLAGAGFLASPFYTTLYENYS